MEFSKNICINEHSRIPKYRQIVDAVIYNITSGKINPYEKIPSISFFSEEFYLSRDTVERAYKVLKDRKIISSIKGKGFYVMPTPTDSVSKTNILFLINKFSSYKMIMYNAFMQSIGSNVNVDLQVYHCDESLFLNIVDRFKSSYDYYVIMPHFKTEDLKHISYTQSVVDAIKTIPSEKLILVDNNMMNLGSGITEIYQDFENDIYNGLIAGYDKIIRYKNIILVYPEKSVYPFPKRILHGFRKFCVEFNIDFQIISEIREDMVLEKNDLFITLVESDLINLMNLIRVNKYSLGKDVGVISFNDDPLKDLLGISVFSSDFIFMGQKTAELILNRTQEKVKVPFYFIDRNSI